MSDDEIKLTTTSNTTSDGIPFPETPQPAILNEQFSRVYFEYSSENKNNNNNNSK